jgi:hypothetical protein
MRVLGRSKSQKIEVVADASGLTSRAGTVLLAGFCQRIGLTDLLCATRTASRISLAWTSRRIELSLEGGTLGDGVLGERPPLQLR